MPNPAALVVRKSARESSELTLVRRAQIATQSTTTTETLQRKLEETVERRVIQRVETLVARELSLDSAYTRSLSDRIHSGLYDSLVLEKERLGWR